MNIGKTIRILGVAFLLTTPGFAATGVHSPATASLDREVRQAINTLPNYGVFDDINFRLDDNGVVTLKGQVRTYVVHNQALAALKRIPGITKVQDEIETLPLSRYDDDLRYRAYYAIFGDPTLTRYLNRAISPIRILVKNGDVTIVGVVQSDFDRKVIFARVSSLPYALKVTDALQVEN